MGRPPKEPGEAEASMFSVRLRLRSAPDVDLADFGATLATFTPALARPGRVLVRRRFVVARSLTHSAGDGSAPRSI